MKKEDFEIFDEITYLNRMLKNKIHQAEYDYMLKKINVMKMRKAISQRKEIKELMNKISELHDKRTQLLGE